MTLGCSAIPSGRRSKSLGDGYQFNLRISIMERRRSYIILTKSGDAVQILTVYRS